MHLKTFPLIIIASTLEIIKPASFVTNIMCRLCMWTSSSKISVFDACTLQDHKGIPKCILVTCVPFLADAPPEWKVSLVDTPGFGEFESRVETLATEALKSSSAYVYITTYANLHSKASADYLRFIFQHDQGTVTCILQSVLVQSDNVSVQRCMYHV